MEIYEILKHCDHTELKQTATFEDIKTLIDDAIKFGTASVCIPPCYVKEAADYAKTRMKICTVIGFPNGYNTLECKAFETEQALKNGADEIDMVINIGKLKAKDYDYVKNEISELKELCKSKILKVIIETCLLTNDEKVMMCKIITEAKADFIKTSTGFSSAGATFEDILLFSQNIGKDVKMKAAGGIRSMAAAENYLALGAERLGTSAIVKLAKESI